MTRQRVRTVGAAIAIAIAGMTIAPAGAAAHARTQGGHRLRVASMQVDHRTNPLGLDDPTPGFSWTLASPVDGEHQTAYRIRVTTAPGRPHGGPRVVWDSGRVRSRDSVGIPYGGPALASATRYDWSVEVWDASGRRPARSHQARWETGLLHPADWAGAQWITPRAADQGSWSDFTLDADFTIRSGAASFLFRARDTSNFYMWQINTASSPGKVMLRPHVDLGGAFRTLGEIDLSPVLTPDNADETHHFRLRADGNTFTTWIDGVQVDTRTDDSLAAGTIGFRTSITAGVPEQADYDDLSVTAPDGGELFADDFSASPDPSFPQTAIVDGRLRPAGDVTLLSSDAPAPMLRHEFALRKRVASARAYVYGLGFYELHLNGGKVGDLALTPSASQYGERSLYDTYDVTDALRRGENAVGLWLGNGYGARYSPYGFRYLGPKQAIMLIRVTFADGSRQDVTTSTGGWRWSSGPITADDIYDGEAYDARLQQRGWDRPGFDDAGWKPVHAADAPSDELTARPQPPVRVTDTLHAVALAQPEPGVYVYDFGQDIAGWERLHVRGPAGTRIRMRTAEELDGSGMLDTVTNRNAASTDTYVLSGDGEETYEPRFTYHGFRYVEVTGFPGTPTLRSLEARVAHADVRSTGRFESSDPLLDRIWRMNRWGIANNSMWTPTDTPVRDERTPPAMDVQAYKDASTREFDMDRFYAKYLGDLPPGRALPHDAVKAQYPDMAGGQVSLAWTLYEQYGDRATLSEHYPAMKAFVDRNAAEHPDLIWPGDAGFGDWCPPVHGDAADGGIGGPGAGDCFSEVSLVNTALWFEQAVDTAKAARALGRAADAEHFAALAEDVRDAFNRRFLDGDTYGDGRQTTSVLPLAFGMVPREDVAAVGDRLVRTILDDDAGHLDTGIFGTRYLVDALARIGRIDVAMTVLDQETYPGFGFELGHGATTPWEQWTYAAGMLTHDHAMFSGVNASLYTRLAGITPASAGYRTVDIAPQVPPTLRHAGATIDTVRGPVGSRWRRTPSGLRLDVEIPVNSTATVHVPLLGARHVRAPRGARRLRADGDEAVYAVGSGQWAFVAGAR